MINAHYLSLEWVVFEVVCFFGFFFFEKERGEAKAEHNALHMYVQMC